MRVGKDYPNFSLETQISFPRICTGFPVETTVDTVTPQCWYTSCTLRVDRAELAYLMQMWRPTTWASGLMLSANRQPLSPSSFETNVRVTDRSFQAVRTEAAPLTQSVGIPCVPSPFGSTMAKPSQLWQRFRTILVGIEIEPTLPCNLRLATVIFCLGARAHTHLNRLQRNIGLYQRLRPASAPYVSKPYGKICRAKHST
ncbi:hypothetical protein DFH08DRAFT_394610 [Mycena albidolilacea]|uniref:Uncharacterized protein n=1 Tax=Mycena albidolilacea TaxID=1033008 RepID=A0AAD7EF75_9AGAR|nr:hypothetical protein DFH08DRAFT_394610 [Mycena albidolilacea]